MGSWGEIIPLIGIITLFIPGFWAHLVPCRQNWCFFCIYLRDFFLTGEGESLLYLFDIPIEQMSNEKRAPSCLGYFSGMKCYTAIWA